MAVKIYKYTVPGRATAPVRRWLQPQNQNGRLVIWAELDDSLPETSWALIPVGTGWELEGEDAKFIQSGTYCGTAIVDPYVWHVYACEMKPGDKQSWS